ncbi:MAG: NADH-quinone oxidoreductase subunit C [bacterium JZ-2024 1]
MLEPSQAAEKISGRFADAGVTASLENDWIKVIAPRAIVRSVLEFIKTDPEIAGVYLRDLTAVDWKDRFEVLYHIKSMRFGYKIEVRTEAPRTHPIVPSAVGIWSAADWQEREVYDLFGIEFEGHPRLSRILLPDDWEGHPLRKDYPIQGPLKEEPIRWDHLFAKYKEEEKKGAG